MEPLATAYIAPSHCTRRSCPSQCLPARATVALSMSLPRSYSISTDRKQFATKVHGHAEDGCLGAIKIGEVGVKTLSQIQIIRSLAEALAWLEKELAWKTDPAELRHLTGRIGELYAAMITRGQMAPGVNQRGYDVVSADNERISVKTVTSSTTVTFRRSTLDVVDRVMILRINIDEGEPSIEEVFDGSLGDMLNQCRETSGDYQFLVARRSSGIKRPLTELSVSAQAQHGRRTINQYENGTIEVLTNGVREAVAKPVLRELCAELGIDPLNSNGNAKNTRTLGANVITTLNEREAEATG